MYLSFYQRNSITAPIMGGPGTTVVNQVYGNGAELTGIYVSDGGSPVTVTGFVVYPLGNPTYTIGSPGVTNFPSTTTSSPINLNVSGLLPSTNYCARPYATNIVGTSYGEEVCFTTLQAVKLFRVGGSLEDLSENFFMHGGNKYILCKYNVPSNDFAVVNSFAVIKSFNNDFTSFSDLYVNDANLNSHYGIHTIFKHSNGKLYGFGSSNVTNTFSDVRLTLVRFSSSFVEEARQVWSVNQSGFFGNIEEIIEDPSNGNLVLSTVGRNGAGFCAKVVVVHPNTLSLLVDSQAIGFGGGVTGVWTAGFSQFRTPTTVESFGIKNTFIVSQNTPIVRFTTNISTGTITAQQELDYGERIRAIWRRVTIPGSTDFFMLYGRYTSGTTFSSGIIVTKFDTNYNPLVTWRYDINGTNQGSIQQGFCNGPHLFLLGSQGATAVVIQVNANTGAVVDKMGLTGTSGTTSFNGILFEGSEVFLRGQTSNTVPSGTQDVLLCRLTLPFLTSGSTTPPGFNLSNPTVTHTVLSNPTWIASSLPIALRPRTAVTASPEGPDAAYLGTITTNTWSI